MTTTRIAVGKYLGTLIAGNVVDFYSAQGNYNWVSIWTVPFTMAIVFLTGFLFLFREDVKKRYDRDMI